MSQHICVDLIDPDPNQPRKNKPVEYLRDELAVSIASRGLRNAIHVRENSDVAGKFWIINGECRWTAVSLFVKKIANELGITKNHGWYLDDDGKLWIECKVIEYDADAEKEIFIDQIMDNEVRLNMGALETLQAYQRALEMGATIGELSKAFGKTEKTIEADLPILNMPEVMLRAFDKGEIPKSICRKLGTLKNHSQMEKAWEWAKRGKDVDGMLKKIDAYLAQVNQTSLFDQAKKDATPKDRKDARVQFAKLSKAIQNYMKTPYSNGKGELVVLVKSNELAEVEIIARDMAKLATKIMDDVKSFKAQKKSAVA